MDYQIPEDMPREVADKPAYTYFIMPIAILIAAVVISGTLLYTHQASRNGELAQINKDQPDDTKPVDIAVTDNDHILGDKNAKVTIVEFSDLQCPFCRQFAEATLPSIKQQYIDTGKARLVYRHFPLDFHPASKPSAEALECAGEQGKFWQLHDKIFAEEAKKGQGTIEYGKPDIKRWALGLGMNAIQFNKCLDADKYAGRIEADTNYGASIGVSGTPAFFINGKRLIGAQPFATFKATIDAAMQ